MSDDRDMFMEFLKSFENSGNIESEDARRLYQKTLQAQWRKVSNEIIEKVEITNDDK